jgi:hypothetical protein
MSPGKVGTTRQRVQRAVMSAVQEAQDPAQSLDVRGG